MWIVYNQEDSWELGYSVESEKEAINICESNPNELAYIYVDFPYIQAEVGFYDFETDTLYRG